MHCVIVFPFFLKYLTNAECISIIIIIIIIIQFLFISHMGSNVIRFKFRANMYLKQQVIPCLILTQPFRCFLDLRYCNDWRQ